MEPLCSNRSLTRRMRGFTLVEMLVVLTIITIVSVIMLVGQASFNRSTLLTDSAYTVALSIRQAQSFGLSSRRYQSSGTDISNAGYGTHFAIATPTSYFTFVDISATQPELSNCISGTSGRPDDKPGNCIYDSSGTPDAIMTRYSFDRGARIADFCGKDAGGTRRCAADGYLTALDIVFLRTSTESIISGYRSTGAWIPLTNAEVYLRSADNVGVRSICVSSVGQVAVATSTCP